MEYLSISKRNPQFPAYLDFQILRQIGIDRLQQLSGKLWTDYNLHDPGVTILEVLCYAITDLGYRNNLEIEDLLALKPNATENNFFTPDQILTCNPVTMLDIRKRLIDIDGVHNAWLEKVTDYNPPIWIDAANNRLQLTVNPAENLPRLHPRGLYTVYLDLEPDYRQDAHGQFYRSWSDVFEEVKQVLWNYRNLCEDIHDIIVLDEEDIKLVADIELETDADGEDVLVEIYGQVQDFLVPQIHFYTLQQLLEKGRSTAEIFAGRPSTLHTSTIEQQSERYTSHGFIDADELENLTLPKILHTSDFYSTIRGVPGIVAIKKLFIASSINGLPQAQPSPWYLQLTEHYRPVLNVQDSLIRLFKNGLPIPVNLDEVQRRYYEQRSTHIKTRQDPYELDLTVPTGQYSEELEKHYSIHHDFPLTYGISEDGLPGTVSAQRQAQAKQLKGYLVFFDQLLANYLAQLAHVRELFSWETGTDRKYTYYTQKIDFPGVEEIIEDYDHPQKYLAAITENAETYRDRRDRFLDHLLARFSESFADYVLLNYRMFENHQDKMQHKLHLIQEKARFLQDYPTLSRDRFRAFNYSQCNEVWDTENVTGFKKRVSRLLGIEDIQRRNLNHYKVELDPGGFTVSIQGAASNQALTSKQVFKTQVAAQAAVEKFLAFALCANYYKKLTYKYVKRETQNPNHEDRAAQYGYALVDHEGTVLAECSQRFSSFHHRDIALYNWLSNLRAGQCSDLQQSVSPLVEYSSSHGVITQPQNQFHFEVQPSETGYFFVLKQSDRVVLRGLKSSATADIAWKDAYTFAENLFYLNRYISSVQDQTEQTYSIGITNEQGELLAISLLSNTEGRTAATENTPLSLFKYLNSVEPFLTIESVQVESQTELTVRYRYQFRDSNNAILLEGTQLFEDVGTAHDRFYHDVLGVLFEPEMRYFSTTPEGFSFGVLSRSGCFKNKVAIHPQTYTTELERDAVVNRLFFLIRTVQVGITINQQSQAYIGRIHGQDGSILLQTTQRYNTADDAWKYSSILMELASAEVEFAGRAVQDSQNFRLIDMDVEKGALQGIYGWELTTEAKDQALATHFYKSQDDRDQAIKTLQQRANDEGFHVLEHILLRPRQRLVDPADPSENNLPDPLENLLPIYVNSDAAMTVDGNLFNVARRDPYSFWVTIVLPYWPDRFQDFNFRRFVERTLRLEAPAHIALKIAWVDVHQMDQFETAYRAWLEQLAQSACEGVAHDLVGSLNRLIDVLTRLRSVHPKGRLFSAQESRFQTNPIILNQTALGSAID